MFSLAQFRTSTQLQNRVIQVARAIVGLFFTSILFFSVFINCGAEGKVDDSFSIRALNSVAQGDEGLPGQHPYRGLSDRFVAGSRGASNRFDAVLPPDLLESLSSEIEAEMIAIQTQEHRVGEHALLRLRAIFNTLARMGLAGHFQVKAFFDAYFPRRAASVSLAERDLFDAQVQKVLVHLGAHGFEADETVAMIINHVRIGNEFDTRSMDPSMQYLVAASIVNAYGGRPYLIEHALMKNGMPLTIGVATSAVAGPGIVGGAYPTHAGGEVMAMDTADFQNGIYDTGDGVNLAVHEFGHVIDSIDGIYDGVLGDFTVEQRAIIEDLVQRFFNDRSLQAEAISLGLNPYAFFDRAHFLVVTIEMYMENSEAIAEIAPELFRLFWEYFGEPPT